MLFNSYIFILLFLPLTLIGYYSLNHFHKEKLAQAFLIGMSLWFYGYNNINYLYVLVVSVLLNFGLVHIMKQKQGSLRKIIFALGVILNLGIIFYFKYYDFFIENMNSIFKSDIGFLRLALPLGISFYTFQQLSYVIDSYRDECEEYPLLEYAMYVTFFPQLIAGPIVYHDELIPVLRKSENKRINYANMSKGLYAFSLGLAKKVMIADNLSPMVSYIFDLSASLNTNSTLFGMVCYTLQLYFDFSGYCDMAYGIGYFFNVELPMNFNSPYKAYSITDFWARWHMTLTRFFTKYVYIPLGGNRKGIIRRDINILIVFLLSGLWHGAAWTFILWGFLHGILNLIDKHIDRYWKKIPKVFTTAVTFSIATYLWMIFRATSFEVVRELSDFVKRWTFGELYYRIPEYIESLLEYEILDRIGLTRFADSTVLAYGFVAVLMAAVFFMRNTYEKVRDMKFNAWKIIVITLLISVSLISFSGVSEFLYFNF